MGRSPWGRTESDMTERELDASGVLELRPGPPPAAGPGLS